MLRLESSPCLAATSWLPRFEQFQFLNRFGEEIVGPRIDCPFDISQFIEGSDHQDHDPLEFRILFELLADFEAAELGHHHVEQNQVWAEGSRFVERLPAVDCDLQFAVSG